MTERQMIRQGDVMLVPVDSIPAGAKRVKVDPRVAGRHVLAYGEVTGHHHSVATADADLLETKAREVYLRVMRETPLEHQEHATIALAPGAWRKVQQVEYTPEAIVNVVD